MAGTTVYQATGVIDSFYDANSGKVRLTDTGEIIDFYHPGAQIEFESDKNVTLLIVVLPQGGKFVQQIGKPA